MEALIRLFESLIFSSSKRVSEGMCVYVNRKLMVADVLNNLIHANFLATQVFDS